MIRKGDNSGRKTFFALMGAFCFSLPVISAVRPANCAVHRGDGIEGAPENSLEAAHKAWSRGFIPECDVRKSAAGLRIMTSAPVRAISGRMCAFPHGTLFSPR